MPNRNLWDGYDWQSRSSWGALLAAAGLIAVPCMVASVLAEYIVRDVLALEFGDTIDLADVLAFAIAMGLLIPGFRMLTRVIRRHDTASSAPDGGPEKPGLRLQLQQLAVFTVFFYAAMAIYVGLYSSVNRLLAVEFIGNLTFIAAPLIFTISVFSLNPLLARLGAKPLPDALEHHPA